MAFLRKSEESRVLLPQLLLASCLAVPCLSSDNPCAIRGTVYNASNGNLPVAGAEVVLQAQTDGATIPLAQTTSDEQGRFLFDGLPLEGDTVFLPGANRDGVYYPGKRLRLGPDHVEADVSVWVFDAMSDPSPLIARRHEISIRTEPSLLSVTETIWVSNPSLYCYVGGGDQGERPVTLRLRIPSDFEKVTFHKEFYGRRFALIDGVLMTTIPWPPGERELRFTYILPIEKRHQLWERPLDLPCGAVRLSVIASNSKGIACNLPYVQTSDAGEVVFEYQGGSLPAGHTIRVEFDRLSVPFSAYARWIALGTLATLITALGIAMLMRRYLTKRGSKLQEWSSQPTPRRSISSPAKSGIRTQRQPVGQPIQGQRPPVRLRSGRRR